MLSLRLVPAALVALLLAAPVIAATSEAASAADDVIAQRQDLMKTDGQLLRKAMSAKGTDGVDDLKQLQANFGKLPTLFPPGSTATNSHALPVIWQQFDQFKGLFAKAQAATGDAIADAQAGDEAKYKTDLRAVFKVCGDCHGTFRADMQ
jgi:cytochrome c556